MKTIQWMTAAMTMAVVGALGCGPLHDGTMGANGQTLSAAAVQQARNACQQPDGTLSLYSTADQLRALMVGRWLLCSGTAAVGGSSALGLDVRSDGTWVVLVDGGNGTLAPQTGFGSAGSYDIIDTSAMNGPGHYQVNFNTQNSGVDMVPAFMTSPKKAQFSGMGGSPIYAAIE